MPWGRSFLTPINRYENWGSEMFGNHPKPESQQTESRLKPRSVHLQRPSSFYTIVCLPEKQNEDTPPRSVHHHDLQDKGFWLIAAPGTSVWTLPWLSSPSPFSEPLIFKLDTYCFLGLWFHLSSQLSKSLKVAVGIPPRSLSPSLKGLFSFLPLLS